jgi:hypothetical protein
LFKNKKLIKIISAFIVLICIAIFVFVFNLSKIPARLIAKPSSFPTKNSVGWKPKIKKLKVFNGQMIITKNGTKIDGYEIRGPVLVEASNVTITRSLIISPTTWYAVRQWSQFNNLNMSYVEITAAKNSHPDTAILGGTEMKLDHVYVHGTQRGIFATDGMKLTNSYVDNFINPSSNHAQAVLSSGNVKNVTIYNNVLGCHTNNCTSAISMFPEQGPNINWKITYNLVRGGSYCVYLGNSGTEKPNIQILFENNKFDTLYSINCGIYGPVESWSKDPSNVWKNNTWYSPSESKNGKLVEF